MLNVAIAVESPASSNAQSESLVSAACEAILGLGRCPVAAELEPGEVVAWFALVRPVDRELSRARVQFRDRAADGVLIEEREVRFSSEQGLPQRLQSLGAVVAAMAQARQGMRARAPRSRPARARPSTSAADPSVSEPKLGMSALLVPAFGDQPQRFGGLFDVRLGWAPRQFVVLGSRYTADGGNPSFSWWTLSAGVGSRLDPRLGHVRLELAAEAVLERTSIHAELGLAHESATRLGWGGRLGALLVWTNWRHFGLTLGIDGSVVLPRITVVVPEREVTRVPSSSLGVSVGVRFEP